MTVLNLQNKANTMMNGYGIVVFVMKHVMQTKQCEDKKIRATVHAI